MKNRLPFPLLPAVAALLILASALLLAEPKEADRLAVASVTAENLEAKVAETENATGLGDEARKRLLELYRKALDNLNSAASDTQAAETYARVIDEAPARIEAQREALVDLQARESAQAPVFSQSETLPQLAQHLQNEQADLAVARAQLSDTESRLAELSARPPLIRERLALAREQREEVATQLKLPYAKTEDATLNQARQWELESRLQKLNAEIKKLDQELLSEPLRMELLKIEQDKALAGKEWSAKRVKQLDDLVNQKRQAEAEQKLAQAEAIREGAEGKHPIIVRQAERNAALSEEIAGTMSVLGHLSERTQQAGERARRIEDDFKSARETISIGGLSRELGQMLLQQRFLLPDLNTFRREANERENTAARIGVRRLSYRQQQRQLRDLDAYVASLATTDTPDLLALLDHELRALARERQTLLQKAIATDDIYLRKLGELESAQQRLFDQVKGFDEFMAVHLLWVRSSSPADLAGLGASPEEVWRILSPKGWREVGLSLLHQVTHSPVFTLLVLVLGALLWWRKRIVAAIPALRTSVGKPRIDRFSYTLQAFVLTLIAAAGLPLLMLVTGWQLKVSSEGTSFSFAVGQALVLVTAVVFFVRFLRMACIEQGLAEAHYRWPAARVQLLRTELDRLTWIFLPAAMVAAVAVQLVPLNGGWALGRVAFLL